MSGSTACLTEARDWHGRWTAGDAGVGAPPDRADIAKATYTIVAQAPADQRRALESALHRGAREALVNLLQAMLGIGSAHADTLKSALQTGGMSETAAKNLADAASALGKPPSSETAKRAQDCVAAACNDIGSANLSRTLARATKEVAKAADGQGEQIPANLQPLVMPNPASHLHKTFNGASGAQCVAFIQAVVPNAGLTSSWIMGPAVTENTPPDTVVATFDPVTKKYANKGGESHVGVLVSKQSNGDMTLLDQYVTQNKVDYSRYKADTISNEPIENPANYHVVLIPK